MIFTLASSAAAAVAAVCLVLGVAIALHVTSLRGQGFINYFAPIMLFMTALAVVVSTRNLSVLKEVEDIVVSARPVIVTWFSRFASLFLILAAIERIVSYLVELGSDGSRSRRAPLALLLAFFFMWMTTVLATALFGAVPKLSHEYFYTLLIGCATLMVGRGESIRAVELARDGALLFMLATVIAVPLLPIDKTLEMAYSEGWIPGLPRLHGLALHAVGLGMFALVGLLCLWNRPYRLAWVNAGSWVLALSVLVAAQSKVAWAAFGLCATCIVIVRWSRPVAKWVGARSNASAVSAMLIFGAVAAVALSGVLAFGDLGNKIALFLTSDEGARLMTLTGRERIWEIAFQEWARSPVFGFGPTLFNEDYRMSIGVVSATHGHNQLVDTLARSGLVGVVGVGFYVLVLTYYAIKFAVATRGLSLALVLLMLQRSITEVPFDLFGYSPENIPHFVLLMVIAGEVSARAAETSKGKAKIPAMTRASVSRPGQSAHQSRRSAN